MKLSLIIPCYNDAARLKRTLASVLSECEDTQIIVVDNNSTKEHDELADLKEKYSNLVEFYETVPGDQGTGYARNMGLSKIRGEWTMFADSDDYFYEGWFKKVSQYFESEYDIVYFSLGSETELNKEPPSRHIQYERLIKTYLQKRERSELIIRCNWVLSQSRLLRSRLIFENNLHFENVRFSDDVMFNVKAGYYANKIYVDESTIYCLVERGDSVTKNVSYEAKKAHLCEFCKQNLFLRQNLNRKDYNYISVRQGAYKRFKNTVKDRDFATIVSVFLLYRQYKVPLAANILRIMYCKIRNMFALQNLLQ